jgi:hypothetical protein
MGDMTLPEVFRQQRLDRRRDENRRLLPEHTASLTIGVPYDPPLIYR